MKYTYNTKGVCSRKIEIEMDPETNTIKNVNFVGGCPGNLLGISHLVENSDAEDIITRLKGTKCGFKQTSCPDQLAQALEDILANA